MITLDEIRDQIAARGWTCRPKLRRGKPYIYAVRREGARLTEKYLGAVDRPDILDQIATLPNRHGQAEQIDDQAPAPTFPDERQISTQQAESPSTTGQDEEGYQAQLLAKELTILAGRMPNFAEILHKAAREGRITGYTPPTKYIWPSAAIYTHLARGDVLRGVDLAREIRRELQQNEWLLSPLEKLVHAVRPGDTPATCEALARFTALLRPYLLYPEVKSKPVTPSLFDNREVLPNSKPGPDRNIAKRTASAGRQKDETPTPRLALDPSELTALAAVFSKRELSQHELDALTIYSRQNLKYQGQYDLARRAWLAVWAGRNNYKAHGYAEHSKNFYGESTYVMHSIPDGAEAWTHFLTIATQYSVYCAFVATFAPEPLEVYLKDAERRGEIKLADPLIWKPGDQKKRR
jgi:hypothetical protein